MVADVESVGVSEEETGWGALMVGERRVTTVLLFITTGLFAFSEFFVSAAAPSAAAEFAKPWLLPWSFIVFLITAVTSGAAASAVRPRFGMRWPLVISNLVFIFGSGLAALAADPAMLLVGRAAQGAGEGMAVALCYMLIPQVYSGALIARIFGMESVVWAVASFIAPATAGALTQFVSWRAPFALSVPAALILLILSFFVPDEEAADSDGVRVPWLQLSLLAVAILLMSTAGLTGQQEALLLLAGAVALIALFVRVDRLSRSPILPSQAFGVRSLIGSGTWVIFFMPLTTAAGAIYFIYGMIETAGLETLTASIVRSLLAIFWSLTAFAVSHLARDKREACIVLGASLLALGYAILFGAFYWSSIVLGGIGQIIVGMSFGLTWGPVSQLLMEKAPLAERDRVSALLTPLQSVGSAIGGAIFGVVASLAGIKATATAGEIHFALVLIFGLGFLTALFTFGFGQVMRKQIAQ